MSNNHDNNAIKKYTFDEVGVPYDFGDFEIHLLEENGSSTTSTSSSESNKSFEPKPEPNKDIYEDGERPPPRLLRVRGRLDGRLQILNAVKDKVGVWESHDDYWRTAKNPSRNFSYKVLAPTLHRFPVLSREHRSPFIDAFHEHDKLQLSHKLKLRGRIDGRVFHPESQTQWKRLQSRTNESTKGFDSAQFTIPSFHESYKWNHLLDNVQPKSRKLGEKRNRKLMTLPNANPFSSKTKSKSDPSSPRGTKGLVFEPKTLDPSSSHGNTIKSNNLDASSDYPLQIGFDSTQAFRGRVDGRLHTPRKMEFQTEFFVCPSGQPAAESLYQDLTFNDSLTLDQKLHPDSTNVFQQSKRKDMPNQSLQLRERVDGRLHALSRNANWEIDAQCYPSLRARDESNTSKVLPSPSFIQELYACVLPHSTAADSEMGQNDKRQNSAEFPTSFDLEFVADMNLENESRSNTLSLTSEKADPTLQFTPLTKATSELSFDSMVAPIEDPGATVEEPTTTVKNPIVLDETTRSSLAEAESYSSSSSKRKMVDNQLQPIKAHISRKTPLPNKIIYRV